MSDQPEMPQHDLKDNLVTTRHEASIGGRRIAYTATAGHLVLRSEAELTDAATGQKPRAQVFVTAYTRDDVEDPSTRPLTFCFNGGPGSSSVWLHLGMIGPRRVELSADGYPTGGPPRLIDNEYSLLDRTDLVFIDPVSTGYSRPVEGEKAGDWHGYQPDLEAVGEVIRMWLTRSGRWLSPKYLAGESYGTTRAAGLAGHLQERHGITLDGLMLISAVLDFSTIMFHEGNDRPPLLYLPSYAATAWYHGRLAPDLQERPLEEVLREVEEYAFDHYAPALLRGSRLEPAQREEVAGQVARYTGMSREFVERNNLRVPLRRFCKELLRDERRTVGRLDSRYTGTDRDAGGEAFEYDPSHAVIQGPFTACLNDYVRNELEFRSDLPYEILKSLFSTWKYDDFQNRYVYVAETLRKAMSMNPALRVHVASGYYDLATPYFAADHTFDHLGVEPPLRDNVSFSYYESGHMMYLHLDSLKKLKEELDRFLSS